VRNGSISGFYVGVGLGASEGASGSLVEKVRVSGALGTWIDAAGIVTDNIAVANQNGISGNGTFTHKYVASNNLDGLFVGFGSTVIGNTASGNGGAGITVNCPSNVTDNTAFPNLPNLVLNDASFCNNTNNVAP
jgi:hypothetical protein